MSGQARPAVGDPPDRARFLAKPYATDDLPLHVGEFCRASSPAAPSTPEKNHHGVIGSELMPLEGLQSLRLACRNAWLRARS